MNQTANKKIKIPHTRHDFEVIFSLLRIRLALPLRGIIPVGKILFFKVPSAYKSIDKWYRASERWRPYFIDILKTVPLESYRLWYLSVFYIENDRRNKNKTQLLKRKQYNTHRTVILVTLPLEEMILAAYPISPGNNGIRSVIAQAMGVLQTFGLPFPDSVIVSNESISAYSMVTDGQRFLVKVYGSMINADILIENEIPKGSEIYNLADKGNDFITRLKELKNSMISY